MSRTRLVMATSVALTIMGAVVAAHADPDSSVFGTYDLSGYQGSKQDTVALVVKADGSVSRTATFSDGTSLTLAGTGVFTNPTSLTVTFSTASSTKLPASKTVGVTGALDEENGTVSAPADAATTTNASITGNYVFDAGSVNGRLTNNDPSSDWKSAVESGRKKDDSSSELKILAPANGTGVLNGQVLDVKVQPQDADFEVVSGPARKALNSQLQVTGTGDVVLVATKDGKKSDPVTVHSETAEVCALEVQNTQPIDDAKPPHMSRDLGSNKDPVQQPAALLLGQPLVVKVTLKSQFDLGVAAKVMLTSSGDATLKGQGSVSSLKAGDSVVVQTASAFATKVDVHKLQLEWKLSMTGSSVSLNKTPLHVYTCFKPAIRNGPYYGEPLHPLTIKDHFEKACTWASGTSENVGNGDSSIGWHLDNYVRHHVHPVDFKKSNMPFTCAYPWDSRTPPMNYGDLPDHDRTKSSGERPVGQLYYPPLDNEIKDHAKEDYSHYSQNFGWWVLDNPTHTGGRCNQQASLMCDLFGTMGIKAHVHYLQRVGVGKTSGRPVRQYFNSSEGGEYWNFHGLAEATLADGSSWLYDGSFSWAPDRKNGLTSWAEAPGRWINQDTPFIYNFGPWYYEDGFGGTVPDSDVPTVHVDGDNGDRGQYWGVPAAKGESLTWYNDNGGKNQ